MKPQALQMQTVNTSEGAGGNKTVYIVLIGIAVVLVVGFLYLLRRNIAGDTSNDKELIDVSNVGVSDDTSDVNNAGGNTTGSTTGDTDSSNNDSDTLGDDTDFLQYSEEKQEVGSSTDTKYTLTSIEDSSKGDYHRFVFELEGDESKTDEPPVIAQYKSSRSAIRVTLSDVESDEAAITYLSDRAIGKNGIVKLYHNVSNEENVSVYEIGVSQPTSFYLHLNSTGSTQQVVVDVRYPGSTSEGSETTLGSATFSKSHQDLDGATASEGAKVTGFSYRSAGGVLSMYFVVSGSVSEPLPKAFAEYSDGDLKLTFPDLKSYTVPGDEHTLPGVGLVKVSKNGNKVVYTFTQVHNNKFKLDGSLSPNEISFEVEL